MEANVTTLPNRYEYDIGYTCGGCSTAVNRILGKMKDMSGFKAWLVPNWEEKKAYAWFDTSEAPEEVQVEMDKRFQKWAAAAQKEVSFAKFEAVEIDANASYPQEEDEQ